MEGRGVAERALAFLKGMQALDTLDALMNLACTLLGNPLMLCDARGNIQSMTPEDLPGCAAWADMARTRRIREERLAQARAHQTGHARVWPGGAEGGPPCAYLALPVPMDDVNPPGALLVYAWLRDFDRADIQLAETIAGALEVLIKRKFGAACMAQTARLQLLKELLGYKPGLDSYFSRAVAIENMNDMPGLFRAAYIHLGADKYPRAEALSGMIRRYLDGAWTFPHEDHLVCVFCEELVSPRDFSGALDAYLKEFELSGCLSLGFRQITGLRHAYEAARYAWQVGVRLEPDQCLLRAEKYQTLTFLSKCQRYFPIAEYCPDGLYRLIEYDEKTGHEYCRTLSAYLDNHLNANQTAKELFIHRNTLTQRVKRIEEIMCVTLDDKEVCLYLQLSLRIQALARL